VRASEREKILEEGRKLKRENWNYLLQELTGKQKLTAF
jgi:hypothetical protein